MNNEATRSLSALFGRPGSESRYSLFVWLTVSLLVAFVLAFVWTAASPVVKGDDWYYADTLIKHFQDGDLGILDFFGKRVGDNSQPINRLILLGVTAWFKMDLTIQGMLGVLIALACAICLSCFTMRAWPSAGKVVWARILLPIGFATIFLSLNPIGLFGWPLVTTLTFMGTLGAIVYIYAVAGMVKARTWAWIAPVALLTLVLLDTFGILAVMATIVLFTQRAFSGPKDERMNTIAAAAAAAVALVVYQYGYKHITGIQSTPLNGANISAAADYFAAHFGEAWKALVIPFAISVYQPLGGGGRTWQILVPLAVLVWCGHIWFWREYLRNNSHRLAFLGGGLMLYFYATVAGMLLDRVPKNNFDYLFQPRYVAFYELQLAAMLLMAVVVIISGRPVRKSIDSVIVVLISMMLVLNVYFEVRAWDSAKYMHAFDVRLVLQINQLANDPTKLPDNCNPQITPCRWPPDERMEVLQVLRQGGLNVFSPELRQRHGYAWVDPKDQNPTVSAGSR